MKTTLAFIPALLLVAFVGCGDSNSTAENTERDKYESAGYAEAEAPLPDEVDPEADRKTEAARQEVQKAREEAAAGAEARRQEQQRQEEQREAKEKADAEAEAKEKADAEAEAKERIEKLTSGREPFLRKFAWGDGEEVISFNYPELKLSRTEIGKSFSGFSQVDGHKCRIFLYLFEDKLYQCIFMRSGNLLSTELDEREEKSHAYDIVQLLTEKYGESEKIEADLGGFVNSGWTWEKPTLTIKYTLISSSEPVWFLTYTWKSPISAKAEKISEALNKEKEEKDKERRKSDL
jgi:hypothetical protein